MTTKNENDNKKKSCLRCGCEEDAFYEITSPIYGDDGNLCVDCADWELEKKTLDILYRKNAS
jgi:hypothetical protein